MARELCTLLSLLLIVHAAPAAAPSPASPAPSPAAPALARSSSSPCLAAGTEPVLLSRPLAFCGGKAGEPSCCDAASDTTISLAFVNASISRPSSTPGQAEVAHNADADAAAGLAGAEVAPDPDADAAACAAAQVKWKLCHVCFPGASLVAPCSEHLGMGPAPTPHHGSSASSVGTVIGSVLGVSGALLIAWLIWKKMKILQDEEDDGCSCTCSCCNHNTVAIWCC